MRCQRVARSISLCIECLVSWRPIRLARGAATARETRAQATVEAAILLPTFLTVLLLVLQPVCILYTRSVMEAAASETARLMITSAADDEALRAFALRRLAAVPNLEIFHAGGELSWDIALTRAGDSSDAVGGSIKGAVKPLPVLGAFVSALGATNAHGDVELAVDVSYEGRPTWLEGSYETWIEVWD